MRGGKATEARRDEQGIKAARALEPSCRRRIDLKDLLQPHVATPAACEARLHLNQMTPLIWPRQPSPPSAETVEQQQRGAGKAWHSSMNTKHSSLGRMEPSRFPNTQILSLLQIARNRQFHRAITHHFNTNPSPMRRGRKPIQPQTSLEKKKIPSPIAFL